MFGPYIRTIEYIKKENGRRCSSAATHKAEAVRLIAVWVLMLAVLLAGTPESFAAGTYTVSGTFDKGAELGGEVTYTIYRVGELSGGVFTLLPGYSTVGARVNYTKAEFGEEDKADEDAAAWRDAWMASAATLANYVKEEHKAVECTSSDGTFSFTGLASGLYLITGTSQAVPDGTGTTYWAPRPMYVAVDDGDETVSLKPESEHTEPPAPDDHDSFTVTKAWEGDEKVKDLIRPESVEVEIYYGGNSQDDLKVTVTLSDSNNWTYSWNASEDEPDPTEWRVVEKLTEEDAANYSVSYSYNAAGTASSARMITITNTYDRYRLVINKKLPDFVMHAGGYGQALVFEVTCWSGDAAVMHKYAGMVYGPSSDINQSIKISSVPRGTSRVTVSEVYIGNYKPIGPASKEAEFKATDDGKGEWTVSFENEYDNITYGSGIINKYSILNGAFKFDMADGQ